MKKLLFVLICTLLPLGAFACNDKQDVVAPETSYVTIHFVVEPELYEFEAPADMTVEVGFVPTLPMPEGGVPMDAHDELAWFADEMLTTLYDDTQPVTEDLTLYLYEIGKLYSISYQGLEGWTVSGTYVYSYRYQQSTIPLPTVSRDGYANGLYCVELDNHYINVPTGAGQDLTFTAPKARSYDIQYNSGIEGVDMSEIDNPNPTSHDKVGEGLTLLPATYGDRTSTGWVVRLIGSPVTFEVDGEEVTLRDGMSISYLTYDMIRYCKGYFSLEAKWN